jgi:F-type H+-transporting ATPase subunit b
MEALENFGVNWPFFISQLVNFAILFFLLKRFLYKPILEMLEKRRVEIEKGLAEAKRATEEGKKLDEERALMLLQTKNETKVLLDNAIQTSTKIKEEILKEAEEKAKETVALAALRAEEEKKKMMADVKDEVLALAKEIAEKVLREKIDQKTDESYIEKTTK